MSEEKRVDVWDGSWDNFRTRVVNLATLWIRAFNPQQNAFAMEQVIEQIRVGAQQTPSRPWSEKVQMKPIPENNPFLRRIRTVYPSWNNQRTERTGPIRAVYILVHPSVIIMNVYHMFHALTKHIRVHEYPNYATSSDEEKQAVHQNILRDWSVIYDALVDLMETYPAEINDAHETMSFQVLAKNKETQRYTELVFTRALDNSRKRVRYMQKRYKKYYSAEEAFNIDADKRMETLKMTFELRQQPQDSAPLQQPQSIINTSQTGVYGAYQHEIDFVQSVELEIEPRVATVEKAMF